MVRVLCMQRKGRQKMFRESGNLRTGLREKRVGMPEDGYELGGKH